MCVCPKEVYVERFTLEMGVCPKEVYVDRFTLEMCVCALKKST